MATDTLEIFGTEYTGVTGVIATTPNETDLTYIRPQGTKSITQNGSGIDVVNYASVDVNVSGGQPNLQSKTKTYTPTTSQQTESVSADSGYDGLDTVSITVNAMPSGTAGTPIASKGAVSNHSVSVTPSVTNTTGYITGGTKNGTAVTVSVSELVSGTKTITENDTGIDVTNYASVDVNVSGGEMQVGEFTVNSSVATSRVNVGYIDYVQPYFVNLASRGTQSRTGHCPIADDGFMYVTFTGSSDAYTPSVTATSGTATLETSWMSNTQWNGLNVQGVGRIYKLSPNAVVTLTYYNN